LVECPGGARLDLRVPLHAKVLLRLEGLDRLGRQVPVAAPLGGDALQQRTPQLLVAREDPPLEEFTQRELKVDDLWQIHSRVSGLIVFIEFSPPRAAKTFEEQSECQSNQPEMVRLRAMLGAIVMALRAAPVAPMIRDAS
jgi:hypothetical protein